LLVLGVFLRYSAIHNQLWLDEILSLKLIGQLKSPWEIFSLLHDNNHYLNSLFLFEVGPAATADSYRLAAFVFSLLTLSLAVIASFRRGALEGLFGSILFTCSYVVILYGTEARGYSSLIFFALLSFLLLQNFFRHSAMWLALCFSLSSILGMLSHFSFIPFYAALFVWSFFQLLGKKHKLIFSDFLLLNLLPSTTAAAIYIDRFSKLTFAGGPQGSRLEVLVNAVSVPYGGYELSISNLDAGAVALGLAAVILALLFIEIVQEIRAGRSDAWFLFLVVFCAPVILLFVVQPHVFVLRYILLSSVFSYLLAGGFLARMYRRDSAGAAASSILIVAFVIGNGFLFQKLVVSGRGQYREALEFIAENSPQKEIYIGGNQDFRNALLVEYFGERSNTGKSFHYVEGQYPETTKAEWVIIQTQDQLLKPEAKLSDGNLTLSAVFDSAPLSGLRWFVYCRGTACPVITENSAG
jgi:hypothetical protein